MLRKWLLTGLMVLGIRAFSCATHLNLKWKLLSVVEIDKHAVTYKIKGKSFQKECFRRAFVCFKACWQGFLDGCQPYLVVDATALNGRWRGQLVEAYIADGHNWIFLVAFGVVEAESEESWV